MRHYQIDREEQGLLSSIEKGEWKPVKNMADEIREYAKYAKNALKKDQRISIRMSKQDFVGIQSKAVDEGIPYQTLITSIVHKYVNGKLISDAQFAR
ncbi:MAG: antitoxin [Candidatus Omnitrophica bacterium]|nr:antitoxin [Candidatus Omnitrophota bacterium]